MARHLEELALFALPRSSMDDEGGSDDMDAGAPTIRTQAKLGSVEIEFSDEGFETIEDPIEPVYEGERAYFPCVGHKVPYNSRDFLLT